MIIGSQNRLNNILPNPEVLIGDQKNEVRRKHSHSYIQNPPSFSKTSVFACPHVNTKTAFSKKSTLESVFENLRFRCRKRRLRVDARPKWRKKPPFSKISVYVWTGIKLQSSSGNECRDKTIQAQSSLFVIIKTTVLSKRIEIENV